MTQTVILSTPTRRQWAHKLIDAAPDHATVTIRPQDRTLDQNALLWQLLSTISVAKPEGRKHTPEVWKCLLMSACGHAVQFEVGLDGTAFPVGFRSSRLSRHQMSELIEFTMAYAAKHGVQLD